MDSLLIILKKKNGPRASSAPILGLFSITFVYTADVRSAFTGPLVLWSFHWFIFIFSMDLRKILD